MSCERNCKFVVAFAVFLLSAIITGIASQRLYTDSQRMAMSGLLYGVDVHNNIVVTTGHCQGVADRCCEKLINTTYITPAVYQVVMRDIRFDKQTTIDKETLAILIVAILSTVLSLGLLVSIRDRYNYNLIPY